MRGSLKSRQALQFLGDGQATGGGSLAFRLMLRKSTATGCGLASNDDASSSDAVSAVPEPRAEARS